MPSVKRLLPAAVAVLGLALVIWQIRQTGVAPIVDGFRAVGPWGFAAILLLSGTRFVLRSLAWISLVTPPEGHRHVPLTSAFAATLGGDALGNLSFLSLLVSEPTKALYVTTHVPADEALGALTAENVFYSASVALVITAGAALLLATFVLPEGWSSLVWVALVSMAVILVAAGFLVWQRPGVVSRLPWRPSGRVGRGLERLQDLERITYRCLRAAPMKVLIVAGCQVAFHICSIVESWLTLYLLTGESLWLNAFLFDTLNRIINVVFRVVPLRVGIDEFSASSLASILSLPPAIGLTIALVRKARLLFWVTIGLGVVWRRAFTRA